MCEPSASQMHPTMYRCQVKDYQNNPKAFARDVLRFEIALEGVKFLRSLEYAPRDAALTTQTTAPVPTPMSHRRRHPPGRHRGLIPDPAPRGTSVSAAVAAASAGCNESGRQPKGAGVAALHPPAARSSLERPARPHTVCIVCYHLVHQE